MIVSPPSRRRLRRWRDGANVEALREQALIKEARRRARQRRLGNLALIALGLAVLAHAGFVPGGRGRNGADAARPALLSTSTDGNGEIAIADGTGSVAIVDPNGSGLRTLSPCRTGGTRFSSCLAREAAWSPDGTRLAFVRGRLWLSPDRKTRHTAMALYVSEPDANRPRLLARCGSCGGQPGREISWSPDATKIAFSAGGTLFTVDGESRAVRRLTDCTRSSCWDEEPDWSPDGQLIVFTRTVSRGRSSVRSLYTVRPDGSGVTKLQSEGDAMDPRWSPDGQLIAYDSVDVANSHEDEVYVVPADGSLPSRRLASGPAGTGPGAPSWSPDGSQIVYFATPPTEGAFGSEVWTVNSDGTARQRLAHFGCCVETWAPPVWSPDGKQIAFSADHQQLTVASDGSISGRGKGGTYIVNAHESGRTRIWNRPAVALSWQHVH